MAKLSPRNRLVLRCAGGALVLGFLAFVLHAATGFGGSAAETFFGIWDYDALMLGAAASCLARAAIVRRERLAWGLLGAGLLTWTAGEIYYSAAFAGSESVPIPSLADAGYLAFYPLAYAALIVLMRERIGSFPATRWLDGLIVGSAVAALAAALALGPIVDASSSDSTAAVATNLAYPIADLTLLTLVVTAASFTGWRPGAGWLTLGGGLIVLGVSDGLYLWQSAQLRKLDAEIAQAQQRQRELQAIKKQVDDLEMKRATFQRKVDLIERLKAEQSAPVHMLDEVSKALPDFVWLTTMDSVGPPGTSTVKFAGQSSGLTPVADFISALQRSGWFPGVDLVSSTEQNNIVTFAVQASFKSPEVAAKEAQAAARKPIPGSTAAGKPGAAAPPAGR